MPVMLYWEADDVFFFKKIPPHDVDVVATVFKLKTEMLSQFWIPLLRLIGDAASHDGQTSAIHVAIRRNDDGVRLYREEIAVGFDHLQFVS